MDSSLEQLLQAFDCVPQPVFYACGADIIYVNDAAKKQLLTTDMPLTSLTEDAQTLRAGLGTDVTQLQLHLPGGVFSAVTRPLADGRIFVLLEKVLSEAADGAPAGYETGVQLQTLVSIARTMRVPLTNLFGAAGAVFPRLEEMEDPELQLQMSRINRALYQLMHLSCNVGDFTAASAGEMRLLRKKTELCQFFDELYSRVEPLCRAAGATLSCELPQKMMNAWIDRQKIERCVLNLISNAMRHAGEPPQIQLRLMRSGKIALVEVSCGQCEFASGDLAEAFSRHATQTLLPGASWGAGFGLPLAQHIVQLHGGTMMISRKEAGAGAMAVFSIPLGEPDPQAVKSPIAGMDYAGGFRHELVELADVLPLEVFDSSNVN